MTLPLYIRILISPIKLILLFLYTPIMLLLLAAYEEDLALDYLENIIEFGN